MKRVALILAVASLAAPAAASESEDRSKTLGIRDRFASIFDGIEIDLVPDGITDQLVRWQRAMRDLVFQTAENLAALVDETAGRIPDITVLTTEPVENTESSGFGWRDDPIRHRPKFHSGTDFRGKHGTPVLASGSGVVVFVGRRGGYGNLIEIDHGGGVITRYAHLRRFSIKEDAVVLAGQPIGQVGSTGRATGPHLHFEVRLGDRPVDPVTALSVAQLTRESPELGKLAAYALASEIQSTRSSRLDPPKHATKKSKDSRPDRPGREKRVKPLS